VKKSITIGGVTTSSEKAYSDTASVIIDESLPDAAETEVALVLDLSQVTAWYMLSDQDVEVNTNDVQGGSPDDTLTLAAGVAQVWAVDDGVTNPLTVDITKLEVRNDSGSAANFKFRALYDSTV
jgi:hypothetical protein